MKGRWQGSGTWETSGGGGLVLLVIGALLLIGSGAAAAIAAAVMVALIALGAVVVLAVAGLAAFLVYRVRREAVRPATFAVSNPAVTKVPPGGTDLTAGFDTPRALEAPAARELHLHLHGIDPEQVAEILRRHERPE